MAHHIIEVIDDLDAQLGHLRISYHDEPGVMDDF
jgi:hypothetical protein